MVHVGGGIAINWFSGGLRVLCLWPSPGGGGGEWCGGGTACGGGGQGWLLCWLGVWAPCRVAWMLRVRAVRPLWSLACCGAEVRVGGSRLGIRAGLWSVGSGRLPMDGAC